MKARHLDVKVTARYMAIHFHDGISAAEADPFGCTPTTYRNYNGRHAEVMRCDKSSISDLDLFPFQVQAHATEKIIPGDLLRTSDILLKKILETRVTYSFSRFLHALGVREKPVFLNIINVHPLENIS